MRVKKLAERLKRFIFEFGIIGSMAGFITVMPSVGSTLLLAAMYHYSPWLQANQEVGIVIFILIMTILCGFALMGTNLLGIVSGFAFDFQVGFFVYLTGLLSAATVMFLLGKHYASANLQTAIENKPKLRAVQKALINESSWRTLLVLMLIRLSPAVPFAVTNFLVSASGISFKIFILGTVLGMIPRISAMVFVGSSLSELNFNQPQDAWIIIVGITATILAIVLISLISKRALYNLARHKNRELAISTEVL